MPRFVDCEQRTTEWFKVHAGRITASRMCDLTAYSKAKGKEGVELKARADYRAELVAERLSGQMSQHFVTEQMKWGTEQEPYAKSAYEQTRDTMLEEVGFAIHPVYDFAGASPDGICDGTKVVEFKNLTTANHLAILDSGVVPDDYRDQVLWTMLCCECEEADFVSCDSRLAQNAKELELVIIPVPYDEKRIAELEAEAVKMNAEVEAQINRIRNRQMQYRTRE